MACAMMGRAARSLATIVCLIALVGCRAGAPQQMSVAFDAYTDRPVVLTRMVVNDQPLALVPLVVRGRAEATRPQAGASRLLLRYPPGSPGQMALDLAWVELPSGRAYAIRAQVPLDELQTAAAGGVEFMPVFAPGGLLLITSDPVPATADATAIRDVIRLCAPRAPAQDTDFTANPGALPALREALETALTQSPPRCEP